MASITHQVVGNTVFVAGRKVYEGKSHGDAVAEARRLRDAHEGETKKIAKK